jgi:hypothetical protein
LNSFIHAFSVNKIQQSVIDLKQRGYFASLLYNGDWLPPVTEAYPRSTLICASGTICGELWNVKIKGLLKVKVMLSL